MPVFQKPKGVAANPAAKNFRNAVLKTAVRVERLVKRYSH